MYESTSLIHQCFNSSLNSIVPSYSSFPSSYRVMYNVMVGGVLAVTKQQYLAVNGFSNLYWGWGGEDDDMGYRILAAGKTYQMIFAVFSSLQMFYFYTFQKSVTDGRTDGLKDGPKDITCSSDARTHRTKIDRKKLKKKKGSD